MTPENQINLVSEQPQNRKWLGLVVVIVVGVAAIATVVSFLPEQNLAPTPIVSAERGMLQQTECKAGEVCFGPEIRAEDPEGDQVTVRFYDRATNQPVGEPIKVNSGDLVKPEFTFDKPGQQNLYMVVEDGAGHTSKDYPLIIPVSE